MFDPTQPANNSPLSSAVMRSQLSALNDDIQTRATHDEVINARNDAIAVAEANCASECDSVELLQFNANMTYDQNQLQDVINKMNELLNALKG